MRNPAIDATALVAPGARIFGDVHIGPGVFILFGAVIRAEEDLIQIGRDTNVQDNSVLHCDQGFPCTVGDRATLGHGAVIHGARVETSALVGIGAVVLNGASLGEGAWLAAGSVLPEGKSVPAWTLAMGIPAKPIRDLTDDEVKRADEGVEHYISYRETYREYLTGKPGG